MIAPSLCFDRGPPLFNRPVITDSSTAPVNSREIIRFLVGGKEPEPIDDIAVGIEIADDQCRHSRQALSSNQLPGLAFADRLRSWPEVIRNQINIRLQMRIDDLDPLARSTIDQIHTEPPFDGEHIEAEGFEKGVGPGIAQSEPAGPPGDRQAGAKSGDIVGLACGLDHLPAGSTECGGPLRVAAPHLLERDHVTVRRDPIDHLLDRYADPGKAMYIVRRYAEVHYWVRVLEIVGFNAENAGSF